MVLGYPWSSLLCKPFLSKQSTTVGEDMTIWWVPSLWHSVSPPLWKISLCPCKNEYFYMALSPWWCMWCLSILWGRGPRFYIPRQQKQKTVTWFYFMDTWTSWMWYKHVLVVGHESASTCDVSNSPVAWHFVTLLCLFQDLYCHMEANSTSSVVGDGHILHLYLVVDLHISVW